MTVLVRQKAGSAFEIMEEDVDATSPIVFRRPIKIDAIAIIPESLMPSAIKAGVTTYKLKLKLHACFEYEGKLTCSDLTTLLPQLLYAYYVV